MSTQTTITFRDFGPPFALQPPAQQAFSEQPTKVLTLKRCSACTGGCRCRRAAAASQPADWTPWAL